MAGSGDGRRLGCLASDGSVIALEPNQMAASKAPATVRPYVSNVATFHHAARVANPCETQVVQLALKRMHRERRLQQQAAALSDRLVANMLAKAGTSLRGLRDKALVAVAYTTLCRCSELVALVRDDLEIGADGFGTVIIRRGKGDQEGQGAVAPITPDPMRHLRAWIDAASLEAGPLFRAVLKGGRLGGPLDAGDVARIYKAMARRAGLSEADVAQISGHSTRVGASQDMLRYGEQLPAIMQAGGWKTMVARYTAKQGARTSAAVRAPQGVGGHRGGRVPDQACPTWTSPVGVCPGARAWQTRRTEGGMTYAELASARAFQSLGGTVRPPSYGGNRTTIRAMSWCLSHMISRPRTPTQTVCLASPAPLPRHRRCQSEA